MQFIADFPIFSNFDNSIVHGIFLLVNKNTEKYIKKNIYFSYFPLKIINVIICLHIRSLRVYICFLWILSLHKLNCDTRNTTRIQDTLREVVKHDARMALKFKNSWKRLLARDLSYNFTTRSPARSIIREKLRV